MNVYNKSFPMVAMEEYWPPYKGDIVLENYEMLRKKKCRPNITCIQTEMDIAYKMINYVVYVINPYTIIKIAPISVELCWCGKAASKSFEILIREIIVSTETGGIELSFDKFHFHESGGFEY